MEEEKEQAGFGGLKALEIAAIALALFAAAYYSLSWAFGALVHSRSEQVVPELTKKSAMSALNALSARKLALEKEGEEYDGTVPVGTVLRQIPPAGTLVREGKIVRVWLSQGGESVFVPNLAGLSLRNAELLLRQSQLLLGELSEAYSLRSDKGIVISQDPKADASLAKNSLVNIVYSAGEPPPGVLLMPDFGQRQLSEATQWAARSKLTLEVTEDDSSLFPAGTILAQSPAPDTAVTPEAKIQITASARPESGLSQARAHKIHYELSQGGTQSRLRIVLIDQSGERELFNGLRPPGSKIDLAAPYGGPAKARIFVNGILVEEKDLQ